MDHASFFSAPEHVYSDNASVFQKTDKVLHSLYGRREEAVKLLNWKYSFPGDPASNGGTECMIGLMKKYLRNVTFGQKYTRLELNTYLSMVQCAINNRPLYSVNGEVVTPQHFITGNTTLPIPVPTGTLSETLPEHKPFLVARRVHHFWNSWKTNYLNKLAHQQLKKPHRNLQLGDVVVYSPHQVTKRAEWPTGKVVYVHPGPDGVVRCVDIRLDTGEHLERRPVNKLVLLESQMPAGEAVSRRNDPDSEEHFSEPEV